MNPPTEEHERLRKLFCTGAIIGAMSCRTHAAVRDALMTLDLATLERLARAFPEPSGIKKTLPWDSEGGS